MPVFTDEEWGEGWGGAGAAFKRGTMSSLPESGHLSVQKSAVLSTWPITHVHYIWWGRALSRLCSIYSGGICLCHSDVNVYTPWTLVDFLQSEWRRARFWMCRDSVVSVTVMVGEVRRVSNPGIHVRLWLVKWYKKKLDMNINVFILFYEYLRCLIFDYIRFCTPGYRVGLGSLKPPWMQCFC